MTRGGARFTSEEVDEVLSHYTIGNIRHTKHLAVGDSAAPKMVVVTNRGKFLLKRRPKGKDDFYRVAFSHAIQNHLAKRDFPLPILMSTCDEKNTIFQMDHHIYELFKFVSGVRYDGSSEAVTDAGKQLAMFHHHLVDFACQWQPLRHSFHDATVVRRQLRTIGSPHTKRPDEKMHLIGEELMTIYNAASVRVNQLGLDSWPQQIVHGDWHPGNMLFFERKLIAVLDFDSVKIAPPVTDLANGMLQFSIVGNRPNPADWPDYLDQAKLTQFLQGYRDVLPLDENKLKSITDLMIETLVAEAILPVAATGFFGNFHGLDFLKMIQRKASWIDTNRDKLTEAIIG